MSFLFLLMSSIYLHSGRLEGMSDKVPGSITAKVTEVKRKKSGCPFVQEPQLSLQLVENRYPLAHVDGKS
jgi:hypothetical protein